MIEETLLDVAHRAMEAAPEDGAARLRFYARLCDGELFLLLEREGDGEKLEPRLFEPEEGPVVLAFDREERLAEFCGAPAPYAALPGRVLAGLLSGQGIGIGLNLGVAPSSMLLGPEAVDWLAGLLERAPEVVAERPDSVSPPAGLAEAVLTSLEASLAKAAGLAEGAWLVSAAYGGRGGHLLAFEAAAPGAEAALARAVAEALAFSGADEGAVDVAFFAAGDPVLERMARVGLRFDLGVEAAAPAKRRAPGSDPQKPPILR